jgi:hypothetical protein
MKPLSMSYLPATRMRRLRFIVTLLPESETILILDFGSYCGSVTHYRTPSAR